MSISGLGNTRIAIVHELAAPLSHPGQTGLHMYAHLTVIFFVASTFPVSSSRTSLFRSRHITMGSRARPLLNLLRASTFRVLCLEFKS